MDSGCPLASKYLQSNASLKDLQRRSIFFLCTWADPKVVEFKLSHTVYVCTPPHADLHGLRFTLKTERKTGAESSYERGLKLPPLGGLLSLLGGYI